MNGKRDAARRADPIFPPPFWCRPTERIEGSHLGPQATPVARSASTPRWTGYEEIITEPPMRDQIIPSRSRHSGMWETNEKISKTVNMGGAAGSAWRRVHTTITAPPTTRPPAMLDMAQGARRDRPVRDSLPAARPS